MVFESLWRTFDDRFQVILESMRKHRDLIDQEANAIDIFEAKKWRNDCLDSIQQWRVERTIASEKTERDRLGMQVCYVPPFLPRSYSTQECRDVSSTAFKASPN